MKNTTAWVMALSMILTMLILSVAMADDSTYFAQVGFYQEKGVHKLTNYQKGTRIPINTSVKLIDMGSKKIRIVLLDSGEQVTLVNVPNFTKSTTAEIFDKMFGKKKVNLSIYSEKTRRNIKFGVVTRGMTKKTVIRTMGYPPAHETPTTDMDNWTYWVNRFNRTVIHFSEGKVISIQN